MLVAVSLRKTIKATITKKKKNNHKRTFRSSSQATTRPPVYHNKWRFHALPFNCWTSSKEAVNTNFLWPLVWPDRESNLSPPFQWQTFYPIDHWSAAALSTSFFTELKFVALFLLHRFTNSPNFVKRERGCLMLTLFPEWLSFSCLTASCACLFACDSCISRSLMSLSIFFLILTASERDFPSASNVACIDSIALCPDRLKYTWVNSIKN